MATTNEKLLAKNESLKKIVEHNRDYLSCKITLPLGNTALKGVHTNQWLFTDLPPEFDLANWTVLAKALNANTNRFEGYVKNRWYIDGCNIKVKGSTGSMELSLNAFASTYNSYSESVRSMEKAYTDAQNNKNNSSSSSSGSSSKNTTKAVTTKKSVLNRDWIKKYNIAYSVYTKVESICKVSNSDYANVRAIFKWMDGHLPYEGYGGTRYGAAGTLKHGKGNCCDHAHLFAAMCRSIGVKCNYIHNKCCGRGGHVYNRVYLSNPKGIIVDTGRDNASWGSHWGNAGCPVEKTSINF